MDRAIHWWGLDAIIIAFDPECRLPVASAKAGRGEQQFMLQDHGEVQLASCSVGGEQSLKTVPVCLKCFLCSTVDIVLTRVKDLFFGSVSRNVNFL